MKVVDEISKLVTEKDKEIISDIFLGRNSEAETPKEDLKVLFNLWVKYMPRYKQNWGCGSCRNLVNNFWYKVNETYNN
mgnify:CR=1 FL=1|jgi:hypothetical protein